MPLFDLECQACQHRWEDMVRGGETPPPCPKCASADVAKIPSLGLAKVPIDIGTGPGGGSVEFVPTERTSKGQKLRPIIKRNKPK
jgi:putative FmdB family regulatory protein